MEIISALSDIESVSAAFAGQSRFFRDVLEFMQTDVYGTGRTALCRSSGGVGVWTVQV